MKINTIKTIIIAFVMCSLVLGQGSRMGTASSTQLQIIQGAKYLSGGGAASNVVGMDAVYWNPAGLAMGDNNVDIILAHRFYIADIGNEFLGIAKSLGKLGKIGFTARILSIGDIDETTVFQPDGTGQVFTPNYMILGATYSKRLSESTSVGTTINLLNESFGRVSASGVAFDFGVQYRSLLNIEGLNVGFVLKNFGSPMKYTGEGLGVWADAEDVNRPLEYYKVAAASFDLPFMMDMAVSYSIAGANLGLTYTSNYYATDEVRVLAEYVFKDFAALRVGYLYSMPAKDIDALEEQEEWDYTNPFDGLSVGGSLNLKSLINLNLSIDYAMFFTEYFSDNHTISLSFGM